jgi:hypothetical protein
VLPPPSPSLTERYTAVRDRRQPGLEAVGVPLGGFTLYPSLGVAALYDDNVLAAETNGQDDTILRISPQVEVRSNWAVNAVTLRLAATDEHYADLTSENGTDLEAAGDGRLEFSRDTSIRIAARWQRQRETRRSQDIFALTERPVRFSTTGAAIGAEHKASRITLSGEASIQRFDYDDALLRATGTPVDQDFRDSDLIRLRGRVAYSQTPGLAWFGQLTHDRRDHRQARAGFGLRDSRGYEILGGVAFEPAILARGEIGVGYLTRNYTDAQFEDFSGFAVNAKVELFPTQLTTVTIRAKREANDAGIPQSSGYQTTGGDISVDHELLRSLILTAAATYERDVFNGIDRKDRRLGLRGVADYRMNRHMAIRFSYDYLDLDSRGIDRFRAFTDNRLLLGITTRL